MTTFTEHRHSDRAAPSTTADDRSSLSSGLGHLVRLTLRRDRARLSLWVAGIVGLVLATVASIDGLYDTPEELAQYAELVRDNTTLIVQAGPGHGLDAPTIGAVVMNELAIWVFIVVALMNVFIVVRHTRTEEATERAELVRAAPVGRNAGTVAALIGASIANVVVAGGTTAVLAMFGLPTGGTMAFGASIVGVGSVFAAVAAVTAQVASNPRSALGLGGVILAVSFVVRAIGDVGDGRLSWLSPIGWAQGTRAYADERWWVLVLPFAAAALLVWAAFALQAHRDFGSGIVPQRTGRAAAAPMLRTPLGLAVRLQRATVVAWSVGLGLMGFFYGIVADQAETILEENPDMEEFFAGFGDASITDAFLATSLLTMSLVATGFTVSSVLRLRSEEAAQRADWILSTPQARRIWAISHLAVAVVGTVLVLAIIGASMGVGFAMMTGDISHVAELCGAALLMAPASLVTAGIAMGIHGWSPRLSPAAWGALAVVLIIGLFGGLLDLPQWALNVSPFEHVPALPAASFDPVPIVALSATALLLAAVGLHALDRRDLG